MAEKKKINWLLILQGWAMLWVVIGHSPLGSPGAGPEWENILYHFAYSFHMPLFMMVSGWLFHLTRLKTYAIKPGWGGQFPVRGEGLKVNDSSNKRKWTYWAIIKDKALRLLLPGLVFSIVALVLKVTFSGEVNRQVGLGFQDIMMSYLYPYDNAMRELWFIATLFWLMLMTPLWQVLLKQKQLMWASLVILLVLHFVHPQTELLCIGRVFSYAIWFYLGIVISRENLVDRYFTKQPWITVVVGIALYVVGCFVDPFVVTIGGIVFSFGLALLADKYIPKLFCGFRNYTYQIFLMGILAQMAVKIIYRHISTPYIGAYLLCIVAGLYVPAFVSKVIEKINWKPLMVCVGLK